MRTISDQSDLATGDVLYHPAMGFARVQALDEVGLHLDWEAPGSRLPRRISADAARKGYRVCRREGFFARSVIDREMFTALVHDDPPRGLELLLEDLDDAPERDEVAQWLKALDLVDADTFTRWWGRAVSDERRFRFRGRRITRKVRGESDDTSPIDDIGPTPWPRLQILSGMDILDAGVELLGLLATHHAAGAAVGIGPDNTFADDTGRLEIRPQDRGSMATDVHNAGRLLLRRITGRDLPSGMPPHRVMPFLLGVNPDVPPSAMPLLERLVSPLFDHRPPSALGPYRDWAAARAHERIRADSRLAARQVHEVGADTHVGWYKMRDTQTNQDALAVELDDEGGSSMVLVADGISTSDAGSGDRAARLATDVLCGVWERRPKDLREQPKTALEFIEAALREANRAVCDGALDAADGDLTGRIPMGTTIVVAALHGDLVDIVSLGDSRAYLVTAAGTCLLTCDQNIELEWFQGKRSRERDGELLGQALIGYLGHFDEGDLPRLLNPFHRRLRLLESESLVLCTDGIVDYAAQSHVEFLELVDRAVTMERPQQAAQRLVAAANEGGGGDNATAVVVRLTPSG